MSDLTLTAPGQPAAEPASEADRAAATSIDLSQYDEPPTQLLKASTGWTAFGLGELRGRGQLLLALAGRDVRARYKQTVLGVVWVVLQPLIGAGIFSFIFGGVAKLEAPGGEPYFLFVFAGLVLWQSTSTVLLRSGSSLITNQALVGKVYFPRLVLPLSTLLTVLIDLSVSLIVLVLLIATRWHVPGPEVLMAPVALAGAWILALGIGLIIASVAVLYRDAMHLMPVFTQFAMWVSFVMLPLTNVPSEWLRLVWLNPVVPFVETWRAAVLGTTDVPWGYLAYALAVSVAMLGAGIMIFRRIERRFADVI